MPSLKDEAKTLLHQLEASARKKLGQNFMIDENTLRFISNAMDLEKDETVLEIGPGLGFLTRQLFNRGARVFAIEKDPIYARFLTQFFKDKSFRLIEGDVLKSDISKMDFQKPVKVLGNIPYNITSPILEWLIQHKTFISEAVLTVQWEVANRLKAVPGTKEWGALSIFLQFHAEVKILKRISPEAFSPSPKVDSAVIHIRFYEKPHFQVKDEKLFFSTIRRAFQKRRKTLLNALADENDSFFSKKNLETVFQRIKVDPIRRPETLTIQEWVALVNSL